MPTDQFSFYASLIPEEDRVELRRRWDRLAGRGWTHIGLLEGWASDGEGRYAPLEPTLDDLYGVPPGTIYSRHAVEPDWRDGHPQIINRATTGNPAACP